MNLNRSTFKEVSSVQYIKLWDVAVVQPVRMGNHVGVRITVLAEQMVVINLPFLIGFLICSYPMAMSLLIVSKLDSKIVEKSFSEIKKI